MAETAPGCRYTGDDLRRPIARTNAGRELAQHLDVEVGAEVLVLRRRLREEVEKQIRFVPGLVGVYLTPELGRDGLAERPKRRKARGGAHGDVRLVAKRPIPPVTVLLVGRPLGHVLKGDHDLQPVLTRQVDG